jgi:transcriptional regulator with XRE-family HTH domain
MTEKTQITPDQMKVWRERKRFSMAQAARRAGVDRSTWSKWERGIARPTAVNEDQLRHVMDDFEVSLHSTRTRETFHPLLDDELSDLLFLVNLAEEKMGSPMALRIGPMRSDTRMEQLALFFEKYFRRPDTRSSGRMEDMCVYTDAQITATSAGFCVGSLKYAVTDDDAEEWYQAAESLLIDLMAMKKILERDNPKKGEQLWWEAFERFYAGYAAAVDQKCWRDSAWYELRVLGSMLFDTKNILMVRSVISPENCSEPQHRLMFQAILELFDQGKPIDADAIDLRLMEMFPPGAMDRYHWSWPLHHDGLENGTTFVDYVLGEHAKAVDMSELKSWIMEIKQRSLSRRLMDGCRKISNRLEHGLEFGKYVDELEQMISHLKSLVSQPEMGSDRR